MLHGDTYSHSSFSRSVTRCFALRLSLRGEYCWLRHLHTAPSPAKQRTTRLAIGYASLNSRAALDVSTYISYCSSENVCSPESTQQPIAVHGLGISSPTVSQQPIAIRMVEIEPPCRICWPYQHVASRLPRIDSLKNSGNRLSFTSSGSRSRFREGQGQQVPCVGFFTLLGVLRSCVIARVLLLFWDGCCLSLRSCAP